GFRQVVTYSPAPGIVKDVVFFTATPAGGTERRQEEEIAQLGWFSFREARALVTFATDEEVLLAAEAYLNGKS
ncbi:MAG: DNA mismatch repair protein MutT, partial [Oscillospiraceae bacterium]|nr:DNA mismatch repair protein MutT [Oscillospiraceae bacterium]